MGNCLSNRTTKLESPKKIKSQYGIIPSTKVDTQESFVQPISQKQNIPMRLATYFHRKYIELCQSEDNSMTYQSFKKMFSELPFNQETFKNLFTNFNKDHMIKNYRQFKDHLTSALQGNRQLSSWVYNIYFNQIGFHSQKNVRFQSQFKDFFITQNYQEIKIKFRELQKLLHSRVNANDRNNIEEWIYKNIDFDKFKKVFLYGGLIKDQQNAYLMYQKDSKQASLKGTTMIISKRWIDKMIEYFVENYNIKAIRKQSEDLSILFNNVNGRSQYISKIKKMQTLNQQKINLHTSSVIGHESHPRYYDSMDINGRQASLKFKLQPKTDQNKYYSKLIKNHPGEIDNSVLMGNFQWELKNNNRYNIDFLMISPLTYQQIELAFGGGASFSRKIIDGYVELKPSNIRVYQYSKGQLIFLQTKTLERDINVDKIIMNLSEKFMVVYHRNIGYPWEKLQRNNNQHYFGETSFAILVPQKIEQTFIRQYIKDRNYKNPVIGDIYRYKNYESSNQHVCIHEFSSNNYVNFVVLRQNHYIQTKVPKQQFLKKAEFQTNQLHYTHSGKKQRTGISNLGNTCYMGASLQGLFSMRVDNKIFNEKAQFGKQLLKIIKIIQFKKKNCFPIEFKNVYDKKFPFFKGQQQHDAHEFLSQLISVLQEENPKEISEQIQGRIVSINSCLLCKKESKVEQKTTIITLPLRDFKKKQMKIDYILNNILIKTVVFQVSENQTVGGWRKQFEKASHAGQYFLGEVENSEVVKQFIPNKQWDNLPFTEMRIESNSRICAYECEMQKSFEKISQKENYKIYRDLKDRRLLAKVERVLSEIEPNNQEKTPQGPENTANLRYLQVIIKEKQYHRNAQQIVDYNYKFSIYPDEEALKRQMFVSVLNYDDQYQQKIGIPFIFLMKPYYPLTAIRQAIENCIGRGNQYYIRLSVINQPQNCGLCRRHYCNGQKCFRKRERLDPIEWYEGIYQFIIVWNGYNKYYRNIKREKLDYRLADKSNIKEQDDFQISKQNFKKSQEVIMNCEGCKKRDVKVMRRENISLWPKLLILHLERFAVKNGIAVKINTKWRLEEKLIINSYTYSLKAVILHIGQYINYGHYVVVAKGYRYDDELVTQYSYQKIHPEEIYMLMYSQDL